MPKKGENIYKRKDGRWEGRYKSGYNSNGKALYHSIYGKTYSDVKEKLVKIKSERIKGFSVCTLTIKELGLLWISTVEKKVKQSTLSVYITKLNKFIIPILGGVKFDALSVDIINDFINTLVSKKFSVGYIADIAGVLKSILKYTARIYSCADKSGFISAPSKQKQREITMLDTDEEKRLLRYLCSTSTTSNTAILLALTMGMRIGEICALKWSDIDLEKRIITVSHTVQRIRKFSGSQKTELIEMSPKSEKSRREIPVPDVVYKLLQKLKKEPENYFISSSDKITEPRTLQYRFKSILKKENLPSVTFHSLRHLFATKCIAIGIDIKTLSELLGHSTVEVTLNRYVHSSNERKIECMRLYSERLKKVL